MSYNKCQWKHYDTARYENPKPLRGKKGTCTPICCRAEDWITRMSHAEIYTIYIFHISNKKLRSWMSADLDWFKFTTFHFKNLICIHIILPASTNICYPCRQNNYICLRRFATLVEIPFMVSRADKIKFVPGSLLIHPHHHRQVETNHFLSAKYRERLYHGNEAVIPK